MIQQLATALLLTTGVWLSSSEAFAQVLTPAVVSDETHLALAVDAQDKYDRAISMLVTEPDAARSLFGESATDIQRIIDDGVANGELYFNYANALVQSGQVARGIGAYLEAERLMPGDNRITDNLAYARSILPIHSASTSAVPLLDRLASYWTWASYPARAWTASVAWTFAWLLAAALIVIRGHWHARLRRCRGALVGVAAIALVFGLTVAIDEIRHRLNPPGVIVNEEVIVRKGNGDGFSPAFTEPLPVGSEFTLLEQRPGWYHIRLADGQSGWVRTSDAIVAGELDRQTKSQDS